MRIHQNIAAENANRKLGANRSKREKSTERLSSGKKLNRSADDAAGMGISEKMRAQIRGLNQASRNIMDGISLAQTAEGGMQEIHNLMQRGRELLTQALSDTNENEIDRPAIQQELDQLVAEVDDLANNTKFNNIPLLNVPQTTGTPTPETILTQIQASVSSPPVNVDGSFNFFAKNSLGDKSQLVYGRSSPITSWSSFVSLDFGIKENLWDLGGTTVYTAGPPESWDTTFQMNNYGINFDIVQSVSIIDNPSSMGGQSYAINYNVTNKSSKQASFSFMHHIDTQLAGNDDAPLFDASGNHIATATSYVGSSNIPSKISIYDDATNPFINGVIVTKSEPGFTVANPPDKVNVGQFHAVSRYEFSSSDAEVGDSGYAVIWENKTLDPGQTYSMTTYYGVQNPPGVVTNPTTPDPSKKLWIQSGANQNEGVWLNTYDCRARTLGIEPLYTDPRELAEKSLMSIDNAINDVSSFRADAGAKSNRLEHSMRNVDGSAENLSVSESRIRDVDMAKEMAEYVKFDILTQAATAILAQANQTPQGVLSLLS